jgi:hypothetical protein
LNTSEIQIENPKTGAMESVAVNDYFINNPQNVLGTNSTESSQFRANEYTVLPNGDLDVQLAGWVESLPVGIYVPLERSAKEMELAAAAVEVPENIKEGSFYLQGDAIWRRLPDAVIEKNAYRLDYLANGLNDMGKRVFTEATGIALPKQQGATWAVIREWGGISVEEDLKNQAWHKVVVERRAIEPKIGIDPFIWANGKIENGFDQVKKVERETWLVNEAGQGFNLSKKGSHLHLLVPYIKAMTEYEVARGIAQGLEGVKDVGLSGKSTAPAAPDLMDGAVALSSIATAAELGVDARSSVGLDAIVGVDVDHLKTRMVDSMPVDGPAGWVVMNAPRPLLGSQTMTGDFVTGRFYAVIAPDDLMAEKYIEENWKLDARMLIEVPREVQMEMVMGEYRDEYMEMNVDLRWESLSSKLHELRDLPYGELKAKVVEMSMIKEISLSGDVRDRVPVVRARELSGVSR